MSVRGQGYRQSNKNSDNLTPREKEVLKHVFMGKRNAEIAQTLGIVEATVSGCMQRVRDKLGISSDRELIPLVIMARREMVQ